MSGWPSSFVIKVKSVLGSEGAKNAVVLLTTTLLCLLLGEVGYRAYLYNRMPDRFWQHSVWQRPKIEFVSPAHSTFNAQYGFNYPPEQTVLFGAVQAGRIIDCTARRTSALVPGTPWREVGTTLRSRFSPSATPSLPYPTTVYHGPMCFSGFLPRILARPCISAISAATARVFCRCSISLQANCRNCGPISWSSLTLVTTSFATGFGDGLSILVGNGASSPRHRMGANSIRSSQSIQMF